MGAWTELEDGNGQESIVRVDADHCRFVWLMKG